MEIKGETATSDRQVTRLGAGAGPSGAFQCALREGTGGDDRRDVVPSAVRQRESTRRRHASDESGESINTSRIASSSTTIGQTVAAEQQAIAVGEPHLIDIDGHVLVGTRRAR